MSFTKTATKALFAGLCAFVFMGCDEKAQNPQAQRNMVIPAKIQNLKAQKYDLEFDYAARLKAVRSVNVYARVEGILKSQHFKEGELVQQGQMLFKIEDSKYNARASQAKAQHIAALANLTKAQNDWKRVERLYRQGAYNIDQHDTSKYNFESAKANEEAARAQYEDAKLDLSYTNVVADISGRTSMRRYDIGTLVGRGGNDVLTTITQLSPIYAEFSIPSADYDYMRGLNESNVRVEIWLSSGQKYAQEGKIDFVDSTLDSQTLSVKARAIIGNESLTLLPNEFVRVNLKGFGANNAIAIPETAVMQDSVGKFVYVLENGSADIRRIETSRRLSNGSILVASGLSGGDKLIVSNLAKVFKGAQINVLETQEQTAQVSESSQNLSLDSEMLDSENVSKEKISESSQPQKDDKNENKKEEIVFMQ